MTESIFLPMPQFLKDKTSKELEELKDLTNITLCPKVMKYLSSGSNQEVFRDLEWWHKYMASFLPQQDLNKLLSDSIRGNLKDLENKKEVYHTIQKLIEEQYVLQGHLAKPQEKRQLNAESIAQLKAYSNHTVVENQATGTDSVTFSAGTSFSAIHPEQPGNHSNGAPVVTHPATEEKQKDQNEPVKDADDLNHDPKIENAASNVGKGMDENPKTFLSMQNKSGSDGSEGSKKPNLALVVLGFDKSSRIKNPHTSVELVPYADIQVTPKDFSKGSIGIQTKQFVLVAGYLLGKTVEDVDAVPKLREHLLSLIDSAMANNPEFSFCDEKTILSIRKDILLYRLETLLSKINCFYELPISNRMLAVTIATQIWPSKSVFPLMEDLTAKLCKEFCSNLDYLRKYSEVDTSVRQEQMFNLVFTLFRLWNEAFSECFKK